MKRKTYLYTHKAGLSFVFLFYSMLVKWNSKNKNAIFQKIKTGAALVTISSMINSCSSDNNEPVTVTCYEAVVDDTSIVEIKEDTNIVNSVSSDSIGKINASDRVMCYGAPANFDNKEKQYE